MRIYKKCWNKTLLVIFFIFIVLMYHRDIYAAQSINIPNEIYNWSENIDITVNKIGNCGFNAKIDTRSSENDYNYSTISSIFDNAYTATPIFNHSYKGIVFNMINKSSNGIYMNFILSDTENNQISLKEKGTVILINGGRIQAVNYTNNSFFVEKGFRGNVIIPLENLEANKNNKTLFSIDKLASWGIGVMIQGKTLEEIQINNMYWSTDSELKRYNDSLNCDIYGEDVVQIPEHGESIADYSIKSDKTNSYKFQTNNLPEGVSLDTNGRLTLKTSAVKQDIEITAIDKEGVILTKIVSLVESLRKNDNKSFFYGPEELESVTYPFDNVTKRDINFIRFVIIIGCSVVLIAYFIFYRIHKL